MTTLLRGGTIITGAGQRRADLLLDGEKIAWVGRGPQAADREVDVSGCFLFPGFIDAHTHFDLDVANTTTADDFCAGSRAALRGGTTTVIDFACPNKGESLHHGLDLWHQKADGRTFCDYGFHMTIDDWNESIRAELPDMFAQGISSFKMYLTYPAMMIGDRDIYWALKELKRLGASPASTARTPVSLTA
ncbi:MAG: amidohydrolase family protein [Dysosmobacter welbionis]|uniref:amidohydrolase family protein n=1 Tax=Dysosmobacter welbionis TaxID=2093857 RepID=UPI003991768D